MQFSIRKFFLLNLFLTIAISSFLVGIGNYYLDQEDIHEHLDALMVSTGIAYAALLGNKFTHTDWQNIQHSLLNIPAKIKKFEAANSAIPLWKINLQVLDPKGHVLLRSPLTGPIIKAPKNEGLSDVIQGQDKWRVFVTSKTKSKIRIVIAERYESRSHLGKVIAVDDIYILLFAFSISGLLVSIIVGRGLNNLAKVAEEVAYRDPTNLSPVSITKVPLEIQPLVQELNNLLARLAAQFAKEKRFTADCAHELRTPLAALKAQLQVAMGAKTIKEKDLALAKLMLTLDRGVHTVQQLLIISQLSDASYKDGEFTKVNLIQVTQEVLAMLFHMADKKNIELSFNHSEKKLLIKANSTSIAILVRNLVENAIKYSPANTQVMVSVYCEKEAIIFEVTDNGPGISKSERKRVFERFYRVLTPNRQPGSGLGLAIVQKICELHNAKVKLLKPESSSGLTVRVSFPHVLT
ncbi:MAG: hypothetical protein A3F18_04555 [Legionellales bacterium RIFCSPHIGHO2_12_FULL_37_14]|nr:MAG: hypothetical protein A3F18_04555 [Legionellales bacterium RIFCSPHIGHO2_12_FULL_37_14]